MNELIEELTKQLKEGKINFGAGILLACKAQRNACARVYADNLFDDTYTAIGNAKIRRKDYE